jgi:leucyl/phenylalanyl-tRNA---protein transferase
MTGPGALHWIRAEDPPDAFPDPRRALREPDGLLAVGGDLAPARLLAAYRRGIFPWYESGQPILWWSPDPRAVLLPSELKVSASLRKTLRSRALRVSFDTAFARVIDGCAALRPHQRGTWLTPQMRAAYARLHELGYAHSVETWHEGELVGGLYGVALGRVFFGESMYIARRDASKVALCHLVEAARTRGLELIDCQVHSAHLASLGSRTLPRAEFLAWIERLCADARPQSWREDAPAPRGSHAADDGDPRAPSSPVSVREE